MKINYLLSFCLLSLILIGCSPNKTDISGDVFLTFGSGDIKPVAGREIYLFPIAEDIDKSFIPPLKEFINNGKFNIAAEKVKTICSVTEKESLNEITNYSEEFGLSDNLLRQQDCKIIASDLQVLDDLVAEEDVSFQVQKAPLEGELEAYSENEKELQKSIRSLSSSIAKTLQKEAAEKVSSATTAGCDSYGFNMEHSINVVNNSNYNVLSVSIDPKITARGQVLPDNVIDKVITSYSFKERINFSRTNSYGETRPGLDPGERSGSNIVFETKYYSSLPSDRFMESLGLGVTNCSEYSFSQYYNYKVDGPKISSIEFGYPRERTRDPKTLKDSYESQPVDWENEAIKSPKYKNSPLQTDLTNTQEAVVGIILKIDAINKDAESTPNMLRASDKRKSLQSCETLTELQNTALESTACLTTIADKTIIQELANFDSILASQIAAIFSNITNQDLGYATFEELLSAYAKNRNAKILVSGIDGSYAFTDVDYGKYVLFTTYSDRFGNSGHWFEEIAIDAESGTNFDLNNTNYNKTGIYSVLRDKIE